MSTKIRYARASALPAIAAALALSSTPLFAQQVQPAPAETPPPSTATASSTDSAPASSDTTAASPATADTSVTTTDAAGSAAPAAKPVRHVAHAVARHPAKPVTHSASRTTSTHVARSVAAAPAAATAALTARPAPAPAAAPQSAVQPIVSLTTRSAQSSTAVRASVGKHDDTLPIVAGGVLGLLIAGGAAFALTRRRREDEVDWSDDESIGNEPAEPTEERREDAALYDEQPAIVAPPVSAFAWDNRDGGAERTRSNEPLVEEERHAGESWVERAYRGPSPSNPSVSLKNRLKRAAFFDKRERQAAAGLAEPVDPTAGLPEAMVDERESELA